MIAGSVGAGKVFTMISEYLLRLYAYRTLPGCSFGLMLWWYAVVYVAPCNLLVVPIAGVDNRNCPREMFSPHPSP